MTVDTIAHSMKIFVDSRVVVEFTVDDESTIYSTKDPKPFFDLFVHNLQFGNVFLSHFKLWNKTLSEDEMISEMTISNPGLSFSIPTTINDLTDVF